MGGWLLRLDLTVSAIWATAVAALLFSTAASCVCLAILLCCYTFLFGRR